MSDKSEFSSRWYVSCDSVQDAAKYLPSVGSHWIAPSRVKLIEAEIKPYYRGAWDRFLFSVFPQFFLKWFGMHRVWQISQ